MNHQNLVAKLNQIVEQAQLTLQNPQALIAERQNLIIALARFVSTEMSHRGTTFAVSSTPGAPCARISAISATSAQGDEQ